MFIGVYPPVSPWEQSSYLVTYGVTPEENNLPTKVSTFTKGVVEMTHTFAKGLELLQFFFTWIAPSILVLVIGFSWAMLTRVRLRAEAIVAYRFMRSRAVGFLAVYLLGVGATKLVQITVDEGIRQLEVILAFCAAIIVYDVFCRAALELLPVTNWLAARPHKPRRRKARKLGVMTVVIMAALLGWQCYKLDQACLEQTHLLAATQAVNHKLEMGEQPTVTETIASIPEQFQISSR